MSDLAAAIRKVAKPAHNVKVLFFDIETMPHEAYVWGMWDQNVGLSQLIQPGRVFSFSAKWLGQKDVWYFSEYAQGHEDMISAAHDMLNEADVVVTYNGISFDIPHLQREFLLAGLAPPRPYKQIDLMRVVKKQFKFASNKLDFVSQQLGLGRKTSHEGFELWVKCMAGDPKANKKMQVYACQDVKLTEKLYHYLLPWLTTVPHMGQMDGRAHSCWACGGTKLRRDGTAHAFVTSYRLYQCLSCGAWVRGNQRLQEATSTRQVGINK